MDELSQMDATEQAELVRKREVTPAELVEAAIARIDALNPTLNAVVTPMFDRARLEAEGSLPHGPFAGVPFLVKDLGPQLAGVRYTEGSKFLGDFVPDHDSELVTRQRAAGLITVGKTNTPEFGIQPTTEPARFGATHNPWNLERTPGGSSGGSAAAVAAGLVPMAHGNDGGGSIRIPASCCGLFGLKPTRARNSMAPDAGEAWAGFAADHAVTRSVRDSAALLDATSGPAVGDPYFAPTPERPFADEVGIEPGRLRIAVSVSSPLATEVHPDCAAAAMETARLCESLGHDVTEAAPSMDAEEFMEAYISVVMGSTAAGMESLSLRLGRPLSPDEFEEGTWYQYESARDTRAADYVNAVGSLHATARRIATFFEDYDLLLTPTLGLPPVPLGSFRFNREDPDRALTEMLTFIPFTPLFNVTGQPAMSVPLSWNSEGLPIGSHFVGRYGDEATLFRLAAQLEEAQPWKGRKPPTSA